MCLFCGRSVRARVGRRRSPPASTLCTPLSLLTSNRPGPARQILSLPPLAWVRLLAWVAVGALVLLVQRLSRPLAGPLRGPSAPLSPGREYGAIRP
jgi:hypothetical protein